MNLEDLSINQIVYWHSEPVKIVGINIRAGTVQFQGNSGNGPYHHASWSWINSMIFLEPQKSKRFWRWKIAQMARWSVLPDYVDDNGFSTDGLRHWAPGVWENYPKIKLEDDYVDL